MAERLMIDNGLLELEINENGILRFNASDPNVYKRFIALARELPQLEEQYKTTVEERGEGQVEELEQADGILGRMYEFDAEIKRRLAEAFGEENDFDVLLGGVNLMAFGSNGERVITNLLNALTPYMEAGIKRHMQDSAAEAVTEANVNRAQRRATK